MEGWKMGLASGPTMLTLEEISCGLIAHGPWFASTAGQVLRDAKEHGMKLFVLDRYGELAGIAEEISDMVVLRPVERKYNPLKPYGPSSSSVLLCLYAAAFSVGKEHPNGQLVSRAEELAMAGREPTGVALAADLIEQEFDELELLVRPSSVQYLGGKEDFDMEAVLSHDTLVDMSMISSADEATLVCLTCLIRIRNLATHIGGLVLITHPAIFFDTRARPSPASIQFPLDTLCSLVSRGVNIALACPSLRSIPPQMRSMMAVRAHERGDPPRTEILSPRGRRSYANSLSLLGRGLPDEEVERRISPFVLRASEVSLPPWLISDFGEEAGVAVEVIRYVAKEQPSLDQAIGRANELARGLGGSVAGRLVRLRYAAIEQVGSRSIVVLAEKGKRALSLVGEDKP